MPRIPDAEIDRIKRETDLAALVRSRWVDLKPHGTGNLVGTCPFHEDKEPSFIVTPAKGLYHCMGCGAAGNAIQFVEKFDGVSFRHAFEILNAGPAAFSPPSDAPLKKATVPRLDLPFDPESDDATLMRQVVDYYHERLLKTPAALDYLRGRGLYDEEAVDRFRLGFADRTLCLRLPDKNRKDGEAIRTRLQSLGLLRESGHEHFNGSLVLPIFDGEQVVEMYGRKITPKLRKGTPLHLYLPGPHAGIWNAEALNEPEIILCEAPLDALTFWVHGFKNVTFIYGTNGVTDELFDAILARKVRRVRIAYDADDAGNKAALRDADRLTAHGVECFRVKFPHGMDANEYARKACPANGGVTPAPKSLAAALNAAEWLGASHTPTLATPERPRVGGRAPSSLVAIAAKEEAASGSAISAPPRETSSLDRIGEYHALKLRQEWGYPIKYKISA